MTGRTKNGTWKQKLTKKQLKHLKESNITLKWQLLEQKKYMKEMMEKYPGTQPCWECKEILMKLSLWDD